MMDRRVFLLRSLATTAALCFAGQERRLFAAIRAPGAEARFYEKLSGTTLQCQLCFRRCTIAEGKRGFCRNRENRKGMLYSLVYERPAAIQLDPIEKEPMFHNLPGSNILCIGTASCNFRCKFCHNWHLSQHSPEELEHRVEEVSAEDIVEAAVRRKVGLSFTYNEPTVFYEFMFDIARIGRQRGLNTIFHTNGGMRPEPMKALLPHMRGVTIDLKGFTADYYRDTSFASMTPVLDTLRLIKAEGKWLEIVNLIVPTLNDSMKQIREMCVWIKENLGPDVPLHFTRFFPAYKMTHLSPTPVRTLEEARSIAIREGLHYVYIGNVPGHRYNSTFCPRCDTRLIARTHFAVNEITLKNGKCRNCGMPIPGLWEL